MTWVTRGRRSDAAALRQVMFHAIREGAVAYTARQRWAWMPDRRLRKSFVDKVARQNVWVARGVRGPKGFVTLRADGYVDLAFVGPQHQGNGLFRALMTELMIDTGPRSLFTHASLHAQPAFSALGFCVVQHEQIKARGQVLRRALMQLERVAFIVIQDSQLCSDVLLSLPRADMGVTDGQATSDRVTRTCCCFCR